MNLDNYFREYSKLTLLTYVGDIGEWQEDGSMKIIDRKKNIFKLSQGEYVAVQNLENTYSRCPLIDQLKGFGTLKAIHLEPNLFDIELL
ncbi:unnamed protein product [Arabis nemorensis]|uniref:AMP-dependent synthetase/ligase domain-containing protein n=1 Tax=Arabis nemorensis TaxID=586526 RepID=A0A565BGH0_9BRAS|nr:unnamed protein product [Arabis nemorensis]